MTFYVAPVVEGKTEVDCIAKLLHRVWSELLSATETLRVLPASRDYRDKLLDAQLPNLAKKIEEAFVTMMQRVSRDTSGRGIVLVLLDAEKGGCPKTLAPSLLSRALKARSDADVICVLPTWMFENWIVAGASTLAGINDLPDQMPPRGQFEERSGVAWLEKQLRSKNKTRSYKKNVDAKIFVQSMNLAECRSNSSSFDKLCRELEKRLPPKLETESAKP